MQLYLVNHSLEWLEGEQFKRIVCRVLGDHDEGAMVDFSDRYLASLVRGCVSEGDSLAIGRGDFLLCCLDGESNLDLSVFEESMIRFISDEISGYKGPIEIITPVIMCSSDKLEEKLIKVVDLTDFPFPIMVRSMKQLEATITHH
jgi:hypothetical protein